MTSFRILLAAGAGLLAFGAAEPQQVPEEQVFLDEVKKDFLDKIQRCEEQKDWRSLFEHYAHGLRRYAQKVVAIDRGPNPERYTSVSEFLTLRLARLPKDAYEFYRLENDAKARALFNRGREENDRRLIERGIEDYFFSSHTDEHLDALAAARLDEGSPEEAIFYWGRLLRCYPDPHLPRPVLAARIAHACRVAENESALNDLKQHVAETKLDGPVRVGGKEQALSAYLADVQVPVRASVPRPLKMPYAYGIEDREKRRVVGVRNDIKRWTYDFAADRSEPRAEAPAPAGRAPKVVMLAGRRGGEFQPPPFGEYPLFPAYTRARHRDFLIFTDGSRVVAVDPAKVKGASTTTGVYWKYPVSAIVRQNPNANPNVFVAVNRPYIGVSVDGENAFATMYSTLQTRPLEQNPNQIDFFQGTTSLKCFYIPTGKVLWDTDSSPLLEEYKTVCKDFWDRNFSFSSPPLVRGDRLYVGICTSPVGEQESRVLCVDRKTGRPLWTTFLASLAGGGRTAWNWGAGRLMVYQTLLAEQGGVLFAQSSLGAVAGLNAVTGNILWLTKYKRPAPRQQGGAFEPYLIRPANWPVVHRGQVFVLPQDKAEMMAFDRISGKPVDLPTPKTREGELDWKNMTHLLGVVDDWMVVGGAVSHVLRLRDFQAYTLAASNCSRTGRGVVEGELVYLPAIPPQGGGQAGMLAIYDTRTWKSLEQPPWKDASENGNLLVAGNYLVAATSKITVYTDVETIRNEFARRLYQSPPHAGSLLEFGDVMRENDRLEEAAEAYLAFIKAAEGDPAHDARVRQVKSELHGIFVKRGDEAVEKGDTAKALEFYQFARGFAYDEKTATDTTKRLAETYEKLQRWKEAVAEYQGLIDKGRTLYHREADQVMKLWEHARKSIGEIVAKVPDAYEDVEKQAAEALKKAREGGAEALRDVMDRFPNSKAARDAWQRMRDALLKQGKFEKLRSLYSDLKDRFKLDLDFGSYKDLLELLEKLGDLERFRFEMGKFAERFASEKIALADGGEETVKQHAARRLRELDGRPRAARAALRAPLARTAELEAVRPPGDPHGLAVGALPLRPLGIEPADFGRHRELFARGSSVELWDLREKRRLWARPHPGAYLGAVVQEPPGGAPGAAVAAVKPGSPAEKLGLRSGDLLLSVGGRAVDAAGIAELLGSLEPGAEAEVRWRNAGEERSAKVELVSHPAEIRPALVGAAFTRDYALAVAWEDLAASIDLATGQVQWTFRGVRDRFHVQSFHATDGRLFLFESFRADRGRDPLRAPGPQPQPLAAEEAHHRLLCLSDFTGEVVWARAFDFDAGQAVQPVQIAFFGKYLSDAVTFLVESHRPGAKEWVLWTLDSEKHSPAPPLRRTLPGNLLAHAADEEAGILYYVTDISNDRQERYLYSAAMDPGRKEYRSLNVALHPPKYMPRPYASCALGTDGKHLALVVVPSQPGMEYRIWVFHAEDGKELRSLSLPPDRTIPAHRPPAAPVDRDGTLYVYNVPLDPKSGQPAAGRAFLTALRAGAKDAADLMAWDAVAPVLAQGSAWSVLREPEGVAVFTAVRASAPGPNPPAESPSAAVYEKADGGYLHMAWTDLVPPVDAAGRPQSPVLYWRGRLYVSSKQGVQVFGE